MQSLAVTCDKGDQLSHRTKPRQQPPFDGDNEYNEDNNNSNGSDNDKGKDSDKNKAPNTS
jgi:hypothetical protein